MEKKETEKLEYSKPVVKSQKVIERAALACDGTFPNSLYNLKSTYYSCGYNDS